MKDARGAATEYFRCMRERDGAGIFHIFAPDARLVTYWGQEVLGNVAIRDFYRESFHAKVLQPVHGPLIADGPHCAVEIAVETDHGPWRVVDIFAVNDAGQITSLVVYRNFFGAVDAPPRIRMAKGDS